MAFSSQWFIICAVVCSCSAQDFLSILEQNGSQNKEDRSFELQAESPSPSTQGMTAAPETLDRIVEVIVVIEEEFKESYSDPLSDEYEQFVGNFIKKMMKYYRDKKVPNLKNLKVTNISPGPPLRRRRTVRSLEVLNEEVIKPRTESSSVSVTHEVILRIPNGNITEVYGEHYDAVVNATQELVGCTECPYNVTEEPKIAETPVTLEDVCGSNANIPEFYESKDIDGTLKCLSKCDLRHSSPKRCYNKGECNVNQDLGPMCTCQNADSTLYLTDDCQFPIRRIAFYVGLSVTVFCLLLIGAALTVRLVTNRHQQTKKKDMKEKLVNQWLNEEFQWTRSNSPAGATNTAFSSEDPGESSSPVSLYQMTRPFSVNTSPPAQTQSPFPHRGMSPFSPADRFPPGR